MSRFPNAHVHRVTDRHTPSVDGGFRPILWVVGLTLACSGLLELYRPLFYLVDDNLVGVLPMLTESNRRLWSGQWPFVSESIFGGQFALLRDPGAFSMLGPWNLLWSWLSVTPYAHWLMEALSISHAVTVAAAFTWSACWARKAYDLETPDWLIAVLGLSYACTPYNLIIGGMWIGFLNVQASLPVALVGMVHARSRTGILLIAGSAVYALFGGHAHAFTMFVLVLGVSAVALSLTLHRVTPVTRLLIAGVGVIALTMPLLWTALNSMRGTERFAGLPATVITRGRLPMVPQLLGYLAGPAGAFAAMKMGITRDWIFWFGGLLCSSIINVLAVVSLGAAVRQRIVSRAMLYWGCVVLLVMIFMARPDWAVASIGQAPLLRSLRFPFREAWVVVAALHGVALWYGGRLRACSRWLSVAVGMACVIPYLFPLEIFRTYAIDRHLIMSGAAARYWQDLGVHEGIPRRRLIVGGDSALVKQSIDSLPHAVLGTFNFPALYHLTSESGYTIIPAVRVARADLGAQPVSFSGAFSREDATRIAAADPDRWLVLIERVHPVEWTVRQGTTIRRFRLVSDEYRIEEIRQAPSLHTFFP